MPINALSVVSCLGTCVGMLACVSHACVVNVNDDCMPYIVHIHVTACYTSATRVCIATTDITYMHN